MARRLQGEADHRDNQLTVQARARIPKVRWWWGKRTWYEDIDDPTRVSLSPDLGPGTVLRWRTGAWCYLCQAPIATWSSKWQITEQAKAQISLHRQQHLDGTLDSAS